MILTEIGEIGITAGGRHYKLRPSLYAMTQIGEPAEIVRVYASVMSEAPHRDQFGDALSVIFACAEDDLSGLFGAYQAAEPGMGYVPGSAPPEHVIPLAQGLLRHGVTGALPPLPRKADEEPEFVQEFDARSHVSLAIAHLGMSSAEAWQMTMTELVGALRAKFPPSEGGSPGAKAPSKEQMEATMEWFERVEAARSRNLG
ncbi:glycoprotein [Bordetella sp. J329]|nr:glycoprotein [Bordetella sp. J329]